MGNMNGDDPGNEASTAAQILCEKAEALVRTRRYDEALQAMDRACAIEPENAEFRIYRTYYRFLAATGANGVAQDVAEETIREIEHVLETEPHAVGYLFLARLAMKAGSREVSIEHYRKVLEYFPEHHEAQSELRLDARRRAIEDGPDPAAGSLGFVSGDPAPRLVVETRRGPGTGKRRGRPPLKPVDPPSE
jgi:tetratricopeptide (TPR) repeat protein